MRPRVESSFYTDSTPVVRARLPAWEYLSISWVRKPIVPLIWVLVPLLGGGCDTPTFPAAVPANPLPECPDTPNCVRTTLSYEQPGDTLFGAVGHALAELGPVQYRCQPDARRVTAVYRVAGIFKDDVSVAVTEQQKGSQLHVRSASRVGHSDLGVNARRVDWLREVVENAL